MGFYSGKLPALFFGILAILLDGTAMAQIQVQSISQGAFKNVAATVSCTGPSQRISGFVEDVSGATIPFASVHADCGSHAWWATADQTGQYKFEVPPGEYHIEASAPGYSSKKERMRVIVAEGQEAPAIVLKVASASTSVTVTGMQGVTADFASTSTKSTLPILQQPFSISTITPNQLLLQNPQTITSALAYTAGVQSLSVNGPAVAAVDSFDLRGSPADEYLDGMRIPQSFNAVQSGPGSLQLDPNDMQRIDVLLGPSSTLYGQSNLGGIVDAISKRPTRTPVRTLELQIGTYNRYQGGADFAGPIGHSNHFLYRIDGILRRSDTFVYGMQDNRVTLNPSIAWAPTDRTRLIFYGKFLRNTSDSITAYLPALGTVTRAPYGYLPISTNLSDPTFDRYRKNQFLAGYSLEHHGGSRWSVRHQLRYVRMHANIHFIFLVSMLPDGVTGVRTTYLLIPTVQGIQSDTHAQRVIHTGRIRHTLLGGVDYQWQQYAYQQGFGPASTVKVTNPIYGQGNQIPAVSIDQTQTQFQGGLYGQDEAEISNFTLVAGGRIDLTSEDTFNNLSHRSVTSQSPHAFSGHAGISYHVFGLAPYFSYSTSFQPTLGADVHGTPYVPTTGSNVEGGLKYQFEKQPLMLRVAGFSMRQQNVLVPDSSNPLNSIQTGEIHTPGVEVQANGTTLHHLEYILTFQHIHPTNSVSTTNQGKQPVTIADNTASAWLHYAFQTRKLPGLGIGAGVREVGSSWGTPQNTLRVPGFTLFDASLDYSLNRWRFAVNTKNIGNRKFVNGCYSTNLCSYGEPRTVIGTASLHF